MTAKFFCFILFTFAIASSCYSQISVYPVPELRSLLLENIPGVGARAMGMAGAFTAVADDATASAWNPSGLVLLKRPQITFIYDYSDASLNVASASSQSTITSPDSSTTFAYPLQENSFEGHSSGLRFLSASYPFRLTGRDLVLQGSFRTLLNVPDARFKQVYSVTPSLLDVKISIPQRLDLSGNINLYSLSFAGAVLPTLRAGMTLNYMDADLTEKYFLSISYKASRDDFVIEDEDNYQRQTKQSFSDVFFDLGVQWDFFPRWTFGAVYHTPFTTQYRQSELLTLSGIHRIVLGPSSASTQGNLTWPEGYAIGLAFAPNDRSRISVDFSQTNWSDAKRDVFAFATYQLIGVTPSNDFILSPRSGEVQDIPFPHLMEQEDSRSFRIGGEYSLFSSNMKIPVRGGIFRETGMVGMFHEFGDKPPKNIGFALGIGLQAGKFTFDLGWIHSIASSDISFSQTLQGGSLTIENHADIKDLRSSSDQLIASITMRL